MSIFVQYLYYYFKLLLLPLILIYCSIQIFCCLIIFLNFSNIRHEALLLWKNKNSKYCPPLQFNLSLRPSWSPYHMLNASSIVMDHYKFHNINYSTTYCQQNQPIFTRIQNISLLLGWTCLKSKPNSISLNKCISYHIEYHPIINSFLYIDY